MFGDDANFHYEVEAYDNLSLYITCHSFAGHATYGVCVAV